MFIYVFRAANSFGRELLYTVALEIAAENGGKFQDSSKLYEKANLGETTR